MKSDYKSPRRQKIQKSVVVGNRSYVRRSVNIFFLRKIKANWARTPDGG